MKKFNFLSNLWSLLVGSRKDDGSTRYRLVIVSLSTRYRVWQYSLGKIAAVVCMLLTIGIGNAWGVDVNFTYTDLTGQGTSGSGSAFTGATKSDITMGGKGYGNTSYVQIYANGTLTFTPLNGATITKIVLTGTSSTYIRSWNKSSGSISVSGSTATWTGSATSKVTLTNSASSQARITKMDVTYTAGATSHTLSSAVSPTASGSVELSATNVAEGSTATATATPATHYVFDHWSISGTGSTLSSTTTNSTTVTMGTANTTVTATFVAAPKASITLSEAGATTTDASTYYVGDSYTLPSSTEASCGTKVLVGWSTVEVAETNTKPTSNFYEKGETVTLAASQTFYAVFATASGGGGSPTAYTAGDEGTYVLAIYVSDTWYALPATPTVSSGKISGEEITVSNTGGVDYVTSANASGFEWTIADATNGQTISDGSKYIYHSNGGASGTNLAYGTGTTYTWTIESETNGLTFKGTNGSTVNSRGLLASGTTFGGYSLSNEDQSGYYRIHVLPIGGGTTYSAYATSCVAPTSFNVTYNANGDGAGGSTGTTGSVPEDDTDYSSGATVTVLGKNTLAKEGYTFVGWNTAANGSGESYDEDDEFLITTNVTLYAKWEINTYTVTWHVGDVTNTTNDVEHGTLFSALDPENDAPAHGDNALSACGSTKFIGWVKAEGAYTDDGKDVNWYNTYKYAADDEITDNVDIYAMYAEASGNNTDYALYSGVLTEGDYVLVYATTGSALKNTVTSSRLDYDEPSIVADVISSPDASIIWHIAQDGDYWTIYNADVSKYAGGTTTKNQGALLDGVTDYAKWSCSSTAESTTYDFINKGRAGGASDTGNKYLRNNKTGNPAVNYGFACYASGTGGALSLYKLPVSYSNYRTGCTLTCGMPTGLTVVNPSTSVSTVTKTGATIYWTGNATGTLSKYEYAYWVDGDTEPTSGFEDNGTSTNAELSGLYSGLKYNWKVRKVCTGTDGESRWAYSNFITTAASLTYSVPDGVSAVSTPATTANNLNSAGVPTDCGDCWVFAGWTTAAYAANSSAPATLFPEGTKARVSGDATLYAVYLKNKFIRIKQTSDLVNNAYYALGIYNASDDVLVLSNTGQVHYSNDGAVTDVTSMYSAVDADHIYLKGLRENNIWKFTGSASSGQLCNVETGEFINISDEDASLFGTTNNLTFTICAANEEAWVINYSSNYLHGYASDGGTPAYGGYEILTSANWDAESDMSTFMYKCLEYSTYSTAPDCETYSVTWKVEGDEYTTGTPTTSTNTCAGVETLPTDPDDNALACADVFMGWSESELTGTGKGEPDDLFTTVGEAPMIDEDKTFHAVFANVASGSMSTTTHTVNNSGSINSNWEKTNARSAAKNDSYAGQTYTWQMYGYSSDSNPEGEINTTGTYTNVAGVTINVAASVATTVTLYYSSDKSSWTEVSTVSVSKNTSSYTDYSFTLSSMPKTAVYLKLKNSTNSLYLYQVKITTDNRTFNNYTTYCTNEFTKAGNWSTAGNWSLGAVPTIHQPAIIKKAAVVDITTAKARSVVIDQNSNTGKLTIQANKALEVAGTVTRTTDGSNSLPTRPEDLILESSSAGNATLIFDNSNSDQATVYLYSKGYTNKIIGDGGVWNWQFIGVPITNATRLSDYYDGYMYEWDNSIPGWVDKTDFDATLTPFTAYSVSYPTTSDNLHTYEIDGTLVATTNKTIDIAAGKTVQAAANSWTAPIRINDITSTNWLPANIFIYNTGYNYEDDYATQADARYAAGTYLCIPVSSAPYLGESYIASMQGFLIKNTKSDKAGTITLNYGSAVRTDGSTGIEVGAMHAPARTKQKDESAPVVMKIYVSDTEHDDRVVLLEREDFSRGFDNGWDGEKFQVNAVKTAPRLFAINETGGKEAVSAIPEIEGTVIGFRPGTEAMYTIKFDYEGSETYYLLDTKTGFSTLICKTCEYEFSSNGENEDARFIIAKSPATATGIDNSTAGSANVYKMVLDDHIYIIRNGKMYDVTGILCK